MSPAIPTSQLPPDGTELFENEPSRNLQATDKALRQVVVGVDAREVYSDAPTDGTPVYGADCATGVRRFVTAGYRDVPFAAAFLMQLLATIGAAIYGGAAAGEAVPPPSPSPGPEEAPRSTIPSSVLTSCAGAFCAALLCCLAVMCAMRLCPKAFIWGANLVVIAVNLLTAAAITLYADDNTRGAATAWLIFAGIHGLWLFFVRRRIPFAGVLLRHSVDTVVRHYGTLVVSFASLPILGAYILAWVGMSTPTFSALQAYAASCTFQNGAEVCTDSYNQQPGGHPDPTGAAILAVIFLLLLYWTAQVVTNVVHVTAAGTVATWFFAGGANMPPRPTVASLKRAVTTSFGSICLGSLLVAMIRLAHQLLRARRNSRSFLALVALCCVGILERLLQYFNVYAFTHIAIYGTSYVDAAKATWRMVKQCGWAALFNDNLVEPVLALTSLVDSAAVGAAFGFGHASWVIGLMCFAVSMVVHLVMLRVVYSGIVTIFVCVAESAEVAEDANPELWSDLVSASEELQQPTC